MDSIWESTNCECQRAINIFNCFCTSNSMKEVLCLHREMCRTLKLRPGKFPDYYPKLKHCLSRYWKAQLLLNIFDTRANSPEYSQATVCGKNKVLIIGAGPCGLRAAVECQLLGSKVVVIEMRDEVTRNNVVHLWPHVITDLKRLGAKRFYSQFCVGAIDHISIRQLQLILFKICLLLGVEVHEKVKFEGLVEPSVTDQGEKFGWRAAVSPADHPVSKFEFDFIIGANGRKSTLPGFNRTNLRAQLAIAVTANFVNKRTLVDNAVEEINGITYIYDQEMFRHMWEEHGLDLENLVYYRDETHYFVMTAKKHSLLHRGVLRQDYESSSDLLSTENIDHEALLEYARDAGRYATKYKLPLDEFALNHYEKPDVSLIDFTYMYAAENSSHIRERLGYKLLVQLVGDSLLEPFWPTGSGIARGFLSSLDACWVFRHWSQGAHPLNIIAQRESIYRLLGQTKPDNLQPDATRYTLNPSTRYSRLNTTSVSPEQVTCYYHSENLPTDGTKTPGLEASSIPRAVVFSWLGVDPSVGVRGAATPEILAATLRRYRPDLLPENVPDNCIYTVLERKFNVCLPSTTPAEELDNDEIMTYLTEFYLKFKGEIEHIYHESDLFNELQSRLEEEKRKNYHIPPELAPYFGHGKTEDKQTDSHRKSRKRRISIHVSNVDDKVEDKPTYVDPQLELFLSEDKVPVNNAIDFFESLNGCNAHPKMKLPEIPQLSKEQVAFLEKPTQVERIVEEKKVGQLDKEKISSLHRLLSGVSEKDKLSGILITEAIEKHICKLMDLNKKFGGRKFRAEARQVIDLTNIFENISLNRAKNVAKQCPKFMERVSNLENLLSSDFGAGPKGARGGVRVAKLAADLASGLTAPNNKKLGTKPKDLMRSIGKIEKNDWNIRTIEQKILQNQLGRPEPKIAEKVPKWDKKRFEDLQKRLNKPNKDEKWVEFDNKIQKVDQKLKDSGRPDQGTVKVASLANMFMQTEEPEKKPLRTTEHKKKNIRHTIDGIICVVCEKHVFAAECTYADGLRLHKSCFRCAVCAAALLPGLFSIGRGGNLLCRHHSGNRTMLGSTTPASTVITGKTGESEAWSDGSRAATSDDEADHVTLRRSASLGSLYSNGSCYDDNSDDGVVSSDHESCSHMRAVREARRRELPAEGPPPSDSSEVESEEESESSSEEISSATEVSTDSEFEREEVLPATIPPAITVTEAPPRPPPVREVPLSRTRSAGGLATKRALELKRRYLLGEPSPPTVRKSDSTSRLDTKLEAVRSTISEFQKLLHPAPVQPRDSATAYKLMKPKTISDIMEHLSSAQNSLLSEAVPAQSPCNNGRESDVHEPDNHVTQKTDLESMSNESSLTEVSPREVPRLEVHDEGGELIQLDSLIIMNVDEKLTNSVSCPTVVDLDSDSSESGKDATTLALTETELSDWAVENPTLEMCALDEDRGVRNTSRNPRTLSGPKVVHDAKNLNTISSHVCGRSSPPPILYSNALEHFEFADDGEQDPSINRVVTPRNEGYMELVDDDYRDMSPVNDRSLNFIEGRLTDTMNTPTSLSNSTEHKTNDDNSSYDFFDTKLRSSNCNFPVNDTSDKTDLKTPQLLISLEKNESYKEECQEKNSSNESTFTAITPMIDLYSPLSQDPVSDILSSPDVTSLSPTQDTSRDSETLYRQPSLSVSLPSNTKSFELSTSMNLSSDSMSPATPLPLTTKVDELKREREEQTELVKSLVLERLGRTPRSPRKSVRRTRAAPGSCPPPPVPPPLVDETPPPRPALPLSVTPSLSDPQLASTSSPKLSFINNLSSLLHRKRSKWDSDPILSTHMKDRLSSRNKSTSALSAADVPPVPPLPAQYCPQRDSIHRNTRVSNEKEFGGATQAWLCSRRARDSPNAKRREHRARPEDATARRLAHLERRLSRPLNAEQQAAAVAELMQVSAQRDAHRAMLAADRRRSNIEGVE